MGALWLGDRTRGRETGVAKNERRERWRQTRLTEAGLNQDPAWSADGKKIVYTDRNWDDIFQMNADGSDQRNLNRADGMDFSPAYFPTNTKVAFTGVRGEGFQYDIYTMTLNASGQVTGLTRITTTQDADEMQPTVSPDGKRMAFVSDRDGDRDIYVMKVAPEGPTNRPVKLTRSPADDGYPTWSPDGKKIAFQSNRTAPDGTSDFDIWRVRAADGANPTNLTNAPGNDTDPASQPLP